VLLDRERCVLCAAAPGSPTDRRRPVHRAVERGALQQIGIYEEKPFESTSPATPSRSARSAR
jgi:NADH-quinone oxidoreductase subunit G